MPKKGDDVTAEQYVLQGEREAMEVVRAIKGRMVSGRFQPDEMVYYFSSPARF